MATLRLFIRLPVVLLVVLTFQGEPPLVAQVLPEYGAILKSAPRPGPFEFPEVSVPQPVKQPIGDIAFIHKGDIYTVTLDGRYIRRLTTDGRNSFPIWSPNGRHIAFSKAVPSSKKAPAAPLWIITPDGRYARPLTEPEPRKAVYPAAWLPDGKGLLVSVQHLESDVSPELKVVTLDGKPYPAYGKWIKVGRKAGFTESIARQDSRFTLGQAAAFSPDGRKMIFSAATESLPDSDCVRHDLYRMDVSGSNLRRLLKLPQTEINCLRWNPKAAKVLSAEKAYDQAVDREAGMWIRDADGKALKKLADATAASISGMDWSPRGDYIVFQVADSEYPGFEHPDDFYTLSGHSSIWAMKADGSGKYKLADNACHPNWR